MEDWLESYPHSRQVKSHVRNLMHTLFQAGIRWEMVEHNPIDLVRQSGKRLKKPRVLTPAEFKAVLEMLAEPYKTIVITIASLRLRVSELVALKWGDLDFENLTVQVARGFVRGVINSTKTDASEDLLPLDPDLAELLLAHRGRAAYVSDSDYVFANESGQPRWPESLLTPAAAKAGVSRAGWHTFRHTYSSLLHALGTKPAVQKELLRHANIHTTLNVYTRAISEEKRKAAYEVPHKSYEICTCRKAEICVSY